LDIPRYKEFYSAGMSTYKEYGPSY
jgi:hypothetical protein